MYSRRAILILSSLVMIACSRWVTCIAQVGEARGSLVLGQGDVEGDASPELVALNTSTGVVEVFRSTLSGQFVSRVVTRIDMDPIPNSIVTGFVDDDSHVDVVFYRKTGGSRRTASVIFGGDPRGLEFSPIFDFPIPQGYATTVYDLDGDSKLDLAAQDDSGNIHINEPLFDPQRRVSITTDVVSRPVLLTACDLDGDSQVELLQFGAGPSVLCGLHERAGDGEFHTASALTRLPPPGGIPVAVVAVDLNLDGVQEVIVMTETTLGQQRFGYPYIVTLEAGEVLSIVRFGPEIELSAGGAVVEAAKDTESRSLGLLVGAQDSEMESSLQFYRPIDSASLGLEPTCRIRVPRPSAILVHDFNLDGVEEVVVAVQDEEGFGGIVSLPGALEQEECHATHPAYASTSVDELPIVSAIGAQQGIGVDSGIIYAATGEGVLPLTLTQGGHLERSARPISPRVGDLMASGDANGDGVSDIVLADSKMGDITVMALSSDGLAVEKEVFIGGLGPLNSVVFEDCDGDSRVDVLALPVLKSSFIGLFQAESNFGFIAEEVSLQEPVGGLGCGDLQGDGVKDIVTIVRGTRDVRIYEGQGERGFGPPISVQAVHDVWGVSLADTDAKPGIEIVVTSRAGNAVTIIQHTEGVYRSKYMALPHGTFPIASHVVDLDSDGQNDLLLATSQSTSPVVITGPFVPVGRTVSLDESWHRDYAPSEFEVATLHLDENNVLDVATLDRRSGRVKTYLGLHGSPETIAFRRGDANADGKVNLADAISILRQLYIGDPMSRCMDAADADDTGGLNLGDAVFLVLFLFSGGNELPPPGAFECGPDPTRDRLEECTGPCGI